MDSQWDNEIKLDAEKGCFCLSLLLKLRVWLSSAVLPFPLHKAKLAPAYPSTAPTANWNAWIHFLEFS